MKEIHELAIWCPRPTQEEYNRLKQSIKKNGQLVPISLYEEKILDGATRAQICEELKIEPKYEEYTGDNPFQFSISMNFHRRHLSKGKQLHVANEIFKVIKELKLEKKKLTTFGHGGGTSAHHQAGEEFPVADQVSTTGNVKKTIPTYDPYTGEPMEAEIEIPQKVIEENNKSRDAASKMTGVSTRDIRFAQELEKEMPNVYESMAKGKKTSQKAKESLKFQKQKKTNRNVVEFKKQQVQDFGHKFLFGRLGGDYAGERNADFTDESDNIMEAWVGCPEHGFLLSLSFDEEKNKVNDKVVLKLTLLQTKGGKNYMNEKHHEEMDSWNVELETYMYDEGKIIYIGA